MSQPDVSVVAFESKDFNILRMYDEMAAKGWHLNALQRPLGSEFNDILYLFFVLINFVIF